MGLETLQSAVGHGEAGAPLNEEDLQDQERLDDEAALRLVLQDVEISESYVNSKQLPAEWDRIDNLYRAYVETKNWPGTDKKRANLSVPLILEIIENILSQVFMAFFSDPQPFLLTATGKTKPQTARAAAKVLSWAMKIARAKEEFRKIAKSILQYGQGVGMWGWQVGPYDKATYKRDPESKKVKKHVERHEMPMPTFEYVDLRNLLVDSGLRNHDIRNARFVIRQHFINGYDLAELGDQYKNVPTWDELVSIMVAGSEPTEDSLKSNKFQTYRIYQASDQTLNYSMNPMSQPLEILEYWTEDSVITVLQRKIVLRNEENEFGCLPFVSCSLIDVLGSWFGFGVAKLLEGDQKFQAGTVNAWIDGLSLALNPMWHRKKGVGANSQNINSSPGRVVNDDGELAPLKHESNTQEALSALQASEMRATRRVGANFGGAMPTQAMRTAEGASQFAEGVQVRLQYFIEQFADLVYIPTLEAFIQLCKDNLQPEDIAKILTEAEGKDYEGDELDIYNGSYCLEVLSSTKVAARRAMLALVPQLVQLFMAEPVQDSLMVQGKKVDYLEFVEGVADLAGYSLQGIIADMTPEDQQRMQQMNPAVVAAQAKAKMQADKHQNDLDLEEEKATGRAGVQVVRHILDQSKTTPDEVKPLATDLASGQPLATQPPANPADQAAPPAAPPQVVPSQV